MAQELSLQTNIQYLKGVGERRAQLFHKLGVETLGDLLRYYPRDYIDLTSPWEIASAPMEEPCAVRARILRKSGEQRIRRGLSVFKVVAADDSGSMTLTFFNTKYLVDSLQIEEEYLFYGRMSGNLIRREMNTPMVIPMDRATGMMPIYPLTAGITSRTISDCLRQALPKVADLVPEPLPAGIRQELGLCHARYAIEKIHFPGSAQEMAIARKRLIFEELFTLSIALTRVKGQREVLSVEPLSLPDMKPFYDSLPYSPTGSQRQAIEDIRRDLTAGTPMNRLVQGDVGSGKTLVAAAAIYCAAKAGRQAAMMAPTEILAEQHHRTLSAMLEPLGVHVGLLTGSAKVREKNAVRKALAAGEIQVLVGTHALLSQGVDFSALGLVVTDEQHRFGVDQRTALSHKGEHPHMLVMSATPIPRTLALIIYGDLDISIMKEMPVGRIPIRTYRIDSSKRERAFGFIRGFLDRGMQAYIVCPLVETGEVDLGLTPATEYAEKLAEGPFSGYRVGLLHGKMKPAEKEKVMDSFQRGETQLLVATTVIEVGVDVPNAVVMLIENAERFGLSQLHQLRGRVGRGSEQSHCILLSDSKGEEARRRLHTMCKTTSGFEIAEEDLALRGPGDFFGSRQHGLPQLRIADMTTDVQLLEVAQEAARRLMEEDPRLSRPEHRPLLDQVGRMLEQIGERPN